MRVIDFCTLMGRCELERQVLRRYLLFLNDPVSFAKRHGLARPAVIRELVRVKSDMDRATIGARKEVQQRIRAWMASPGTLAEWAEDRVGTWNPREEAKALRGIVEKLAHFGPQLRVFAHGIGHLPGGKKRTMGDLKKLDRRVEAKLASILPADSSYALQRQVILCALCRRAFYHPAAKGRPPKFCPTCRRRWTRRQLWYRVKQRQAKDTTQRRGNQP